MLKITREMLYGGPLARGKRYHYVARVETASACHQVATGATKDECAVNAWQHIAGLLAVEMHSTCVAVAEDGTVLTAREYLPGEVEVMYHRSGAPVGVRQSSGSEMSRLLIDGTRVSAAEYLKHRVDTYNEATRPAETVRHLACRYCGLDIEGFSPFPKGEWHDRGNNTKCPTSTDRIHEPLEAN